MTVRKYHTRSTYAYRRGDFLAVRDPTDVTALHQRHTEAHEEEHFALLHAASDVGMRTSDRNVRDSPVPVESIVDEKGNGELQAGEDDHVEETGQTQSTQNGNV